ncbi:DUF6090 family protein [Leeuwenhoekiella sp. A2]|uniref:DUF6090 family protein n=1 Tax=Leeuwenhoekiella sp. A2 TaxID=3141460 RepID=UPI003A7FFFB0
MIQLFRKLRRNLLSEGKTGQYLKYALGEIALVVIGILIALQINNWNESVKDNNALNEYLGKIKSHTGEDLHQLDTITKYRTQMANVCKKARTRILDKTEDEDLLLLMSCGVAFADYYFKANTGGYDALKNSGYYGKINNTPLDSLLTKYHSLVEEIAENEKSYNDYVLNQEAYLSTHFDTSLILASAFLPPDSLALRATPQSEYYEVFAAYTATPSYRNVIGLAAFQFETMVNQYKQLKNVGENVVNEIDAITND